MAYLSALAWQIAHHRGQNNVAFIVGQALCHAIAHRSHQRMSGTQIDANGNAPLVWIRRLAGFGNLQKCHLKLQCLCGQIKCRRQAHAALPVQIFQ